MSRKAGYKLLCWGDLTLPIPNYVKWIAQDSNGEVWGYAYKPKRPALSYWEGNGKHCMLIPDSAFEYGFEMPEPGPWHEQLYRLD